MNAASPDCRQCRYFYITWDRHFPYGCRFFNIKTSSRPNLEVVKISALSCQGFQPKNTAKAPD